MLVLIFSMLFIGTLSNLLVYRLALNSQFDQFRNQLKIIAQTAALMINPDVLAKVPLNKKGIDTPQYKVVAEKLRKIKEINKPIQYIYTMTLPDENGICKFIVDPVPPTEQEMKKGITSYPGDLYNANRFPEMFNVYKGPTADKKFGMDEWGRVLSGYAPIIDKKGKAIALLGVDMRADDIYAMRKWVHSRAIFILVLGTVLSIILGFLLSRNVTNPIKNLVDATRHIAGGDLHYKLNLKDGYEINELVQSFNQMATSLSESRMELYDYFYRIVQSLVRIIEAKDHYTRGHSERVAEYAEKIAKRMNFAPDKVELLKEATLLHDIGKIGIHESILNKKEKLTKEEWDIIRQHPVIGEDILKPILLTKEMLEIVRWHHERHDGAGYPDKIKGDDTNILSAIVSVADSYDAMTSDRAYRPALSKERAIEELQKNKGTQFNPKVVDVFIQILNESPDQ